MRHSLRPSAASRYRRVVARGLGICTGSFHERKTARKECRFLATVEYYPPTVRLTVVATLAISHGVTAPLPGVTSAARGCRRRAP